MPPSAYRLGAIACALALVLAGCSRGHEATVAPASEQTGAVRWSACGSDVQCASLEVPLDWSHPQGRKIALALARRPASGTRRGVLFTNPGGPGGSGKDFVRSAADVFPPEIRDAFDIVSWDPRGVGESAPVRCLDDLDGFYAVDRNPNTPSEVAANVDAARAFVDACAARSGDLLPFLSTAATVRDMDAIRAAIGAEKVSYVGFSYGTLLGAMYADAYPAHVATMVLDGAVDPSVDAEDSTVQQAASFEHDLDAFLDHCRHDGCAFAHGDDPAAAYDRLAHQVEAAPMTGTVNHEPRRLGPGELDLGVGSALYAGNDGWNDLASALEAMTHGDPAKMLALSDEYTERSSGGKYSNETAALYATSCLDAPSPTSVAAVEQLANRAGRVAPHFGPTTTWLSLPCTFWPVKPQGKVAPVRAVNAPPIVVVGTTNDPATPYGWAQSLAGQLRSGRLLTVAGDSHTSYGRGDDCVDSTVDQYLLHGTLPDAGARCG